MILREHLTLMVAGQAVHTYGEVMPLRTDESYEAGRTPSSVNYRVILPPLNPAETPHSSDTVIWYGSDYDIVGPAMKHTANGKLHHLELLITRATG